MVARGTHPTAVVKPGYKNFWLYTAVNPRTGDEFSLELPEVNADMMTTYLAHFRTAFPSSPLILVMDQAGWHKAKDLSVPEGITLVFLPPYSPELNPIERLWRWLRLHVCRNRLFHSLDDVEAALFAAWSKFTLSFLRQLCACHYL